jgi:uncharacterized protein
MPVVEGHIPAGYPRAVSFCNRSWAGRAGETAPLARYERGQMAGSLFHLGSARRGGKKRPRDREPALRETWLNVVEMFERDHLVIGGKSMGGRIASLIADEAKVAGLVCLGYPFHPAGKPDRLRVEHLRTIETPTLILQGTRDSFGNRDEVAGYRLSPSIRVHWLDDGNHDFTPRKASGRTEEQHWNEAIAAVAGFVGGC